MPQRMVASHVLEDVPIVQNPWPLHAATLHVAETEALHTESRKEAAQLGAPLRVGAKPIGLIYCDRSAGSQPMQPQDYQAFQLFFSQTTLSINRLAGILQSGIYLTAQCPYCRAAHLILIKKQAD